MGTFVVSSILILFLVLILRSMYKKHKAVSKNGGSGCGCSGCCGCPQRKIQNKKKLI